MSSNKSEKFVTDTLNMMLNETREYQAFALGLAYGYYQLYKNMISEYGKEITDHSFESTLTGTEKYNEYFKKLVELDMEKDSAVEELMFRIMEAKKHIK
jgi:hypothetical protein